MTLSLKDNNNKLCGHLLIYSPYRTDPGINCEEGDHDLSFKIFLQYEDLITGGLQRDVVYLG
jgi:hypothetical protein